MNLQEHYINFTLRKYRYIIINCDELDKVNFNEVEQVAADTVRKNKDKTKCILKWILKENSLLQPTFLSKLSSYEGPLSYLELEHILTNSEWELTEDDD